MASGVNKVILMGLLGGDPERKEVGDAVVVNFRLATNESWVDRDGKKQERTEWHSCQCWGKRGEALAKFFGKGDGIHVEGKLQTRSWDDKEGNKRFKTEVRVLEWQFLPGSKTSGPEAGGGSGRGGNSGPRGDDGDPGPGDDDIPF